MPSSLLLLEEITHRVLNEYAEAIGSLSHAAAISPDEDSGRAISEAMARLTAFAEAHRVLQPLGVEGSCDLTAYLARVCARISEARLSECGVRLIVSAEDVWLDAARCWRVGLAVAELIRNAGRHGLRGGSGEIRVTIRESDGQILCAVHDNGQALPMALNGRGMRWVRTLAAELSGTVDWVFTPTGCQVRLELPGDERIPIAARHNGARGRPQSDPDSAP